MSKKKSPPPLHGIEKALTGIEGLDQITLGGIPRGRPTLICGNPGCGKTLLALEIIIRGAIEFNEPGIFLAFEERKEDLIQNIASMGFNLKELINKNLVVIEYIYVDPKGYTETGDYDLEGLFIRIENAVNKIGAKRIAIDTIEVLFSGFGNQNILRAELRRLFIWLKDKQLTTILTGEQGSGENLTRYGIEEYVADCVISLTNIVADDLYTRRLQIVKYRGSFHETNRFPFVIGHQGIIILPITSVNMKFETPSKRISTGIPKLDASLGNKGYFEGSSILLSGSSGSGKTTFAGAFAKSICEKNQKCLFFSYEEAEGEILRNFSSVGLNLNLSIKKGLFKIISIRPTQWGMERHLGNFIEEINAFQPNAVIIDPASTLLHCGRGSQIYSVLTRMIDFSKKLNITLLLTMFSVNDNREEFCYGISSIIDTWILMRNEETNGELNRNFLIIKSRGMEHSNQIREFSISSKGIAIQEPYYGESGVLTGTARIVQLSKDLIDKANNINALEKIKNEIELKKKQIEIQIQGLDTELAFKELEASEENKLIQLRKKMSESTRDDLKKRRFLGDGNKTVKGSHDKKRKN